MAKQIKPWMFRDSNEYLALFASFSLSVLLLLFLGYYIDLWLIIFSIIIVIIYVRLQQAQYLGNAMRVHQNQFPELYQLFINQATRLGIQKANLYIKQDPYLNAYTIGIDTCSVVLNSAIVEQLTTKELSFVIAHELGHFAAGHTKISSLLVPIGNGNMLTNLLLGLWQRKAEYTSDKCGIILTQDLDSTVNAIVKLTVGGNLFEQVNMKGYFSQIKKATSVTSAVSELTLSHPLITNRIKRAVIFWKENFVNQNNA